MNINLVDTTVHIDETVDHATRESLADKVRAMDGVVAAAHHDKRPHLMVVEYDPGKASGVDILATVKSIGIHAELVGL